MQAELPLPTQDPMQVVLDICRRVTLMEPLAARFDAIPMMPPLERVKVAATVVIEAAEEHEYIRDLITRNSCMQAFHAIARMRTGGAVELPQLKADLPGGVAEQTRGVA